jgi:SAM-dependent methyltransferase
MADARDHWEKVYAAKVETAVSWYQPHAVCSLGLIEAAAPDRRASVIDVGGGASTLVDDLLAEGFRDITVLDVAEAALAQTRARLGERGRTVEWLVADITRWKPARTWDIWHDRAVFHFLTEWRQQQAYIEALTAATKPASTVIVATFAPDGPDKCSGLPVQRYDAAGLARRLGPSFELTNQAEERHTTPWGAGQLFSYAVLTRR